MYEFNSFRIGCKSLRTNSIRCRGLGKRCTKKLTGLECLILIGYEIIFAGLRVEAKYKIREEREYVAYYLN